MKLVNSIPAVSVVMPVHNGGAYLEEAVQSVLAQDLADFELVVVDDGSTDDSARRLNGYADADGRVRVISQRQSGIVAALNRGLEAARAPLIARMDADDVALPQRLGKQFDYLMAHPRCVAVGSRILLIDTDGLPICQMCTEQTHEEIDAANLRGGGAAMNHPSVMFRAAVVRAVGGYRKEMIYAEDLDLWLRLAEVGQLRNLPEVLVHYRMHAKSISHARAREQHQQWRSAVRDAGRRRGCDVSPVNTDERPSTVGDHHVRWAWWALMAGNVRTARKHALVGLRRNPLSVESWKLVACTVRGH